MRMPDTFWVLSVPVAGFRVRDGRDVIAGACRPRPVAGLRAFGLFAMFPKPPLQAHSIGGRGSGNERSTEADEC